MDAVVINPHSNTNTSDMYRVVDYDDWIVNGVLGTYEYTEHGSYAEARIVADKINTKAAEKAAAKAGK